MRVRRHHHADRRTSRSWCAGNATGLACAGTSSPRTLAITPASSRASPQGYTGGYQDGTFVGSLLFWIVQRALGNGLAAQVLPVIKYLISQGTDCKVTLSFMNYNRKLLDGLSTYTCKELLPMMQSCAT